MNTKTTTRSPAKKGSRVKAQAANVPVPEDRASAMQTIRRIGEIAREHARTKAAVDDQVARIVAESAERLAALEDQVKTLSQGVQIWCEANRASLTDGGKVKTANLITGEVAWRMRPASVQITGEEQVLRTLRAVGLVAYVRSTETVNKDAILTTFSLAARAAGAPIGPDGDASGDSEAGGEGSAEDAQARALRHVEMLSGISGLRVKRGIEDFSITPFETDTPAAGAA